MPRQLRSFEMPRRASDLPADTWPWGRAWVIPVAVLLAAIFCRLPALNTWWCLDDWGQLARAAGRVDAPPGWPARWLSQHAWWSVTWPLFGLHAVWHAWSRIVLHALAAVTVARIARRASLTPAAQLIAGLLFAATPIAFTPLYWASGIQELLGGTLALLAIERWLAGGRVNVLAAGLLGAGAILAKESALALPLLLMATLVPRRSAKAVRPFLSWLVATALAALAVWEAWLVSTHFATGPRDPYALGGPLVMLGNLGKFGWWLPTPGPVFTAQVTWAKAGIGIAVFLAWAAGAVWAWRRGRRLPLVAWTCALLSLAPVLPLVNQARPYMGYLAAAAGSLTVAGLVPARWIQRDGIVAALIVIVVVWGQTTMRSRMEMLGADEVPADPIVRSAHAARETALGILSTLPARSQEEPFHLVVFQPQLVAPGTSHLLPSNQPAVESRGYVALSGSLGVGLLLGPTAHTRWTSSLLESPADAYVVCEKSKGFQAWGSTYDALLYAAELHVVQGNYQLAVDHLARAFALQRHRKLQVPEADVLAFPRTLLKKPADGFEHWLADMVLNQKISSVEFERYRGFLAVP